MGKATCPSRIVKNFRGFHLLKPLPGSMVKKYRYPQRPFIRHSLRLIGRILLPLLARVKIEGLEHFPHIGPLIVTGDHTGAIEVVLLTLYTPRIIEYLEAIDGAAMATALREPHGLLEWVMEQGCTLGATPIRRYRRTETGDIILINTPQEEDKW